MAVMSAVKQDFAVSASMPWHTPDSGAYSWYEGRWMQTQFKTYDSQAQIELCLNCPFADECKDCVSVMQKRKKFRPMRMKGKFRVVKNKQT